MKKNSAFNSYINALIDNIDYNILPKKVDIVIDSGAFNGNYALGSLIYLKNLEEKKIIKINKISGASIGSILGVLYISNKLEEQFKIFIKILNYYRKNHNLNIVIKELKKTISKYVDDDVSIFNNRLYITYYNIEDMKQHVVCNYKNKKHLLEIVTRSTFIPLLINNDWFYKNKYVDGNTPHFFLKSNNKVLFINILCAKCWKNSFYTKNEKTGFDRILIGINDIHNFFSNRQCDFHSYINNWTISEFLIFRLRNFYHIIMIFILKKILLLYNKYRNYFKSNEYITSINNLLYLFVTDLVTYKIM